MNRYQLQEEIGDGSFGRVIKAQNKDTGEIVAIKHIKNKFKVSRRVFNCVNDGLFTISNYDTNPPPPSHLRYTLVKFYGINTSANNRIGTAV